MLKDILKKCASLLNRDDILSAIYSSSQVSEIENNQIQNDVSRLISYYNFITKTLCEDYFDLICTEDMVSDESGKLYYSNFKHTPIQILNVVNNENNPQKYISYPEYIITESPEKSFCVTYKYLPEDKNNLCDEIEFGLKLPEKIVIYGMASEFLASKNQFNESEFWKNKFMFEIFKIKTKKERRLKSTFCK
jgi:hypothetical protein